jgi:hypothetical protein
MHRSRLPERVLSLKKVRRLGGRFASEKHSITLLALARRDSSNIKLLVYLPSIGRDLEERLCMRQTRRQTEGVSLG